MGMGDSEEPVKPSKGVARAPSRSRELAEAATGNREFFLDKPHSLAAVLANIGEFRHSSRCRHFLWRLKRHTQSCSREVWVMFQ